MVPHWILADTDKINTQTLERIAEVGSRNDYQYTKQGLIWALQEMKRQAISICDGRRAGMWISVI